MCVELDKILGIKPRTCGCSTFLCEHDAPIDPKGGTITLEDLRVWHAAERHRWNCRVCWKEHRAALRALTRPYYEWALRSKRAAAQTRPSRPGRPGGRAKL